MALDKMPGARPIGIGKTWRRSIAKSILGVTDREIAAACKAYTVCAGLQGCIKAAIHAMEAIWDYHHIEEEWGLLLIDANNAFNEMDRTIMLWNIRHEWPPGAIFVFNTYKHCATLVIRTHSGKGDTLHIKQGVNQGDPLASNAYAVGLLPLIRKLKEEFTSVYQPWFADDAGAATKFKLIRAMFLRLQELSP
jgi:hypothetical protein